MSTKSNLLLQSIPFILALLIPPAGGLDLLAVPYRAICSIQGSGFASPYNGELVETGGVVTFDVDQTWEKGFFIQQPGCDSNPETSDALFVYTGVQADLVSVGDVVEVSGWVDEFFGMTEISAGPEYIEVTGAAALPGPVPFSPPWPEAAARKYFESREGMRIAMAETIVVGPTTTFDQTFVVDSALGIERVLTGMPTGPIVRVDDDGTHEIAPEVRTGQRILGLVGILDGGDEYHLRLTAQPTVQLPPSGAIAPTEIPSDLTFATLNLHNLFDNLDDPATQDPVLSPTEYQVKLEKLARMISGILGEPLFIAVQEAENAGVLQALSNRPEIETQYGHVLADGPDFRGIDVGLLYRLDRVGIISAEPRQGCTALVDGLGPDGNLDPLNPANALTCDLDGQPGPDGNRLFSRPPLVVRLEICLETCAAGPGELFWVISVHFKSKSQDTAAVEYTLPRRLEQAAFLAGIVAELEAIDPAAKVIALGDFNDVMGSAPMDLLASAGLVDLLMGVPPGSRYTYIFEGVSQVLDHVFINQALAADPFTLIQAIPQPFAADYPALIAVQPSTPLRASDHDPLLAGVLRFNQAIYLPLIARSP